MTQLDLMCCSRQNQWRRLSSSFSFFSSPSFFFILTDPQKCVKFSMNEKVDFNKWNFYFMRFYIGDHLLKLCGDHILRLWGGHLSRADIPRRATHGAKRHIAPCVYCWKKCEFESDKKKGFWWIPFSVFWKDYGISFICIMYKYVCILVWEKLVYLLNFVLIIIYCDSFPRSHNWFVMSKKDFNWGW